MRQGMASGVLIAAALTLGSFVAPGGASALAAEAHAFNPTLSLTGDCSTSSVDEVPDPGCPGGLHPPSPFASPEGIATDSYGNIYVASYGVGEPFGTHGRIDIFNSEGLFITELSDSKGPRTLAVDGEGNLYVFDFGPSSDEIIRYAPTVYHPAKGEITYGAATQVVQEEGLSNRTGMAVNPANGHLLVNEASKVVEYSSAAEGNERLGSIGEGAFTNPVGFAPGLAVDAAHNRLYASDYHRLLVFELEAPHNLLMTVEGSQTPAGTEFSSGLSVAADEGTGHFFVYDNGGTNVLYEFSLAGEYLSTIKYKMQALFSAEIAVDNGKDSPNGALNPKGRYLFVPSKPSGTGHTFAFGPPLQGPPVIESISFGEVTETEAQLRADVNPESLETTYAFEYTTKQSFEEEGFEDAHIAATGTIPAGDAPVEVSASAEGLSPGVGYVFRVVAQNGEGSSEAEDEFATYSVGEPEPTLCPNKPLRVGPSALLPDCRAYELVTPPNTNGRAPLGVGHLGTYFATREASPGGNAASFEIEGGQIPGFEATGSYAGDPYVSHRTESGWRTEYTGPSAEEAPALLPGSNSPDQGYSFWSTAGGDAGTVPGGGSAQIEKEPTTYVRYPDGHSALIGRGSLRTDPHAVGEMISEGGAHIIFKSGDTADPAIQLEEDAPPSGTRAVYDRTADGVTHVVSLLPGDLTPKEGENAAFEGASLDGAGIAFRVKKSTIVVGPLYFRYQDEETYEVASEEATFAGVAEGGKRVFYVEGGNLYAYEVGGASNPIAFTSSGDVIPVDVSADGTTAYFISPSALTGSEENPNGAIAQAGGNNLYLSEEGTIRFVATVTKRDVEGEWNGSEQVDGLGLWTRAVGAQGGNPGRFGEDPSRTTPAGHVLLFESRASLAGYSPEGHAEIYRYDGTSGTLSCISCNPTKAPATGEASLQSVSAEQGAPEPFGSYAYIENLRADGKRAFFQSTEPLVPADTDGLQDVYEWEAQGVGSCERSEGCVYLISSGHSRSADYLWSVSASGDDVFFRSSDLLTGSDADETPSIYDVRVGGGFPEGEGKACNLNEACPAAVKAPPSFPTPASSATGPSGNLPHRSCPKGKKLVKRHGRKLCVRSKRHHRKAGSGKKGAGR